jgi:hypothetical protein
MPNVIKILVIKAQKVHQTIDQFNKSLFDVIYDLEE